MRYVASTQDGWKYRDLLIFATFSPSSLFYLHTYIETYGFWGSRYKRRSNFSYVDCYTPKLLWRPRWGTWQVPRMGESTRTFWYLPLLDPAHYSIYIYWEYGFWGSRYKIRSNFSYIDCYTPKLLWRPRWGMWQVPRMGESNGTFWYLQLLDPAHYSIYVYWEYGFWGSRYKRRSNFSYIDCYTPILLWRPRWGMWQVPRMGESNGTFWYLPLFHPAHYSIYVYRDIWVLGVPL